MLYLTKTLEALGSARSQLEPFDSREKKWAYVLSRRFRVAPLYWHAGSDIENIRMIENGLRKTQGACCCKQIAQPVQGETKQLSSSYQYRSRE